MPRNIEHRSVTPIIKVFRDICRGRSVKDSLRFSDCLVSRTQPPPNIPGGPYHKTSKVYYYTRDARRLVQPPIEVLAHRQIEAGKDGSTEIKHCTPGKVYIPDK